MGGKRKERQKQAKKFKKQRSAGIERWERAFSDGLKLLSWESATDADLVTVCVQLSEAVKMLVQAHGLRPEQPDELVRAMLPACTHERLEVRISAWSSLCDCIVEAPETVDAAVEHGLAKVVLEMLTRSTARDSTEASTAANELKRQRLRVQLLRTLVMLCDGSADNLSVVGLDAIGAAEAEALCECVGASASAPLALQVVHHFVEAGVSTDSGQGPEGLGYLAARWPALATTLLAPAALPASYPEGAASLAPAGSSSTEEAAHAPGVQPRVLAGAITLYLACEGFVKAGELLDNAVDAVEGSLVVGSCADVAARRVALEALGSALVADGEGEGEGDGEGGGRAMVQRILAARLPARRLLLAPGGLLHALSADLSVADDRHVGALASMHCAGVVLTRCDEAELSEMSSDLWSSLVATAASLPALRAEEQEALLSLLSTLALRTVAPAPPLPSAILTQLADHAARWSVDLKASSAAPLVVAFVGQVVELVRHPELESSERDRLVGPLIADLRAWLQAPSPLAAAEAIAALAESGAMDTASRAALPNVRAALVAMQSGADEDDEDMADPAAHAIELLDAAEREDAGRC